MGARQLSRNSSRANPAQSPQGIHRGWAWAQSPRLIACCLVAVALGVLPSAAISATTAQAASTPKTAFQCKQRYKGAKARAACIKRVASEKPGANCAHPVKAGIGADRWKGGPGVELAYETVQFPHEGRAPPGWADITMGPVTTVPSTDLFYETFSWKLNTSVVALCHVLFEETRPGTAPDGGLNVHYITLPNHTEASYNVELVGGYLYSLTLFERYVRR